MAMTALETDDSGQVEGIRHRHDDLEPASCLFHSLSDAGRLLILQHLLQGEHRVVDLTAHLGLAQSTVSAHVACLRDCGLLSVRREGRSSWYRLSQPDATVALLRAAEHLLGLTGDAVVLCPTHGHSDHDAPTTEAS